MNLISIFLKSIIKFFELWKLLKTDAAKLATVINVLNIIFKYQNWKPQKLNIYLEIITHIAYAVYFECLPFFVHISFRRQKIPMKRR